MAFPKKRPEDRLGNPHYAKSDPRYDGGAAIANVRSTRAGIPIPQPDPKWKPQARSWYNSLHLSAQSELFEASDWATAVAAAEAYNIWLRTYNASTLAQFVRLTERLGCTISDRRRSRIEVSEPDPSDEDEDAADDAVNSWQGRLHSVKDERDA